jgi:hypothetical protein
MKKITTIQPAEKSKIKSVFKASLFLFVISFLLQLFVSNRFAVKNGDLQSFISQKTQLEKDLAQLEYENSLLSSLERVEQEASKIGYIAMSAELRTIGPVMVASLKAN